MLLTQVNVPQVTVPFSPEQASTFAPHVDALYAYLLLITIFFSTLITLLLIFFAVKYRRRQPDVVPGRYTQLWFEATKPGSYYLFCAEYCGTNHSGMGGHVIVMEPTAYQQWLAGGTGAESAASQGAKLFQERGCASCHQTEP